jgi:hypothetical protein
MVELKHDRIALTAVDARMSDKVVVDLLPAPLAVELPLCGGACQIRGPVLSIVLV